MISHKPVRKHTARQVQRGQEAHVVRGTDVEGLVGEISGHKSPEVLNHGTSCVIVKILWHPGARKPVGYMITESCKRDVIYTVLEFQESTEFNGAKKHA